MSHTYHKIWLHIFWGTKCRTPYLTSGLRKKLFAHIRYIAYIKGYHLYIINGVEDHVHCLFSLNPKICISKMINDIKGESSHWINSQKLINQHFTWQQGFSVYSISYKHVDRVRKYIENQENHHNLRSPGKG
jgi:REP-associated tyrosine transposase